jgi:Raf kinase inhibitor-like YbhB/YbcL family protein
MSRCIVALVLLLTACGPTTDTERSTDSAMQTATTTSLRLKSAAFEPGGVIPREHTCDGDDVSPPLSWSGPPEGTQAFALMVTDPDAQEFVHWVLADIPASTTELASGAGDSIGTPGLNDFGRTGWGGPCPPTGIHQYVFRLYALSAPLGLTGTPDAEMVQARLEPLTLAQAELTATYRRS